MSSHNNCHYLVSAKVQYCSIAAMRPLLTNEMSILDLKLKVYGSQVVGGY